MYKTLDEPVITFLSAGSASVCINIECKEICDKFIVSNNKLCNKIIKYLLLSTLHFQQQKIENYTSL